MIKLEKTDTQNLEFLKSQFSNFQDKQFRDYQDDVIEFAITSQAPIKIVMAPPGFGKSLAGCCIGSHFKQFTYLVQSKYLQYQLKNDFPELSLLKGRSNYECIAYLNKTCDECAHTQNKPCKFKGKCIYEIQKLKTIAAPYRLLNYAYYLTETNFIGKFSGSEIVICDEGDTLPDTLANFITLYISPSMTRQFNLQPPQYVTAESKYGVQTWKDWAERLKDMAQSRKSDVEGYIKASETDLDVDVKAYQKELSRLKSLLFQIMVFLRNVNETWLFEEKQAWGNKSYKLPPSYIFKPTWISEELSEQFFFQHAERYVLMSGTFPPRNVLSQLLGRSPGDFEFMEVPSSFPVANRPIYSIPGANITNKTWDEEAPKLIPIINNILHRHPLEKGIMHAVSYKVANYILENVPSSRLITHDSTNKDEVMYDFRNSDDNPVLISPSIERGVDLPDDLCEFIVWCKCPYLYLGDKLVQKRRYSGEIGQIWYQSCAAQTIVQGCGRGMRHDQDKCITYIIDTQIHNLVVSKRWLFPMYWTEAFQIL